MLHSIKGIIPIRLSGLSNVHLEKVKVEDIRNLTSFGSKACGNYKNGFSLVNSVPGFLGGDIRGITIETCRNISLKDVIV